jgi:hypothetical protein
MAKKRRKLCSKKQRRKEFLSKKAQLIIAIDQVIDELEDLSDALKSFLRVKSKEGVVWLPD